MDVSVSRRTGKVGLAIFFTFFSFYLLGDSRERPWSDATPLWEVAENLIAKQQVSISVRWNAPVDGRDGKFYDIHPIFPALVHVPGAALKAAIQAVSPGLGTVVLPLASHLAPALLGAWTCLLFFALARRFVSVAAASLATLFVGVGTMVWFYARSPYSEILQTCCFTGFVLALHDALHESSAAAGRRIGLWAGLLFNSKLVFFVSIPGVALLFAWRLRREPRRLLVFFSWAGAIMLPALGIILFYNWLRWGSPFVTGYGSLEGGNGWIGAWGLLFSPGKSLLLYCPPLVLALFGIAALYRRHPLFTLGLAAAFLPIFWMNAGLPYWHGDWAWGPRYLTFALPVLCLPLALQFESMLVSRRRWLAAPVGGLLLLSVAVQVIGIAFWWGHWIHIALAANDGWLSKPKCTAVPPAKAGELCLPGDEELFDAHWLPQLQPIAGHAWLLRHVPFGDSFAAAEADAPWSMGGKVRLPAAERWYNGARVDWWPLSWKGYELAATVLAIVMGVGFCASVLLWWRHARRIPPEPII